MTDLVLGPLLRYVSETEATIWVETDAPCEVEILGRARADLRGRGAPLRAGPDRGPRAGRLLRVRGRARRRAALARARLATCRRARSAPSAAASRSTSASAPAGSPCPHEEPYTLTKDEPRRRASSSTPCACWRREMVRDERDEWPELLFLLGDQVYVDEGSPRTRERIRARRGTERRRPARGDSTSRSTPGSTRSPGATR